MVEGGHIIVAMPRGAHNYWLGPQSTVYDSAVALILAHLSVLEMLCNIPARLSMVNWLSGIFKGNTAIILLYT